MRTRNAVIGACLLVLLPVHAARGQDDGAALEADNPLKPLPAIPLGVMRHFDALPPAQRPTPSKVRLGRWLFFDTRLSRDATVSCATCHIPEHAFSEPTPVSTGIEGQKGARKAPPIINAAWSAFPHFFWDGRAASLEEQAVGPIANPIEMGNTHEQATAAIAAVAGYRRYFAEAFGDGAVTIERIAQAISAYERTRLSGNSKWDRWQDDPDPGDFEEEEEEYEDDEDEDEDGEVADVRRRQYADGRHVTAQVKLGHDLFHGKAACNQCHLGPNLTDNLFHNLGVGWDPETRKYGDEGRYVVTKVIDDMGAFKTPPLRDVSRHPPYMHDGSVKTLHDVMVLYNKGGEDNPHLSPKIKPLSLTEEEIAALVELLEALDGEGYQDTSPVLFPQ